MDTRKERDSVGELEVPKEAYFGVQSLRGAQNFQITGGKIHPEMVKNVVRIKRAAAIVNANCKELDEQTAAAIVGACDEILNGKFADQFITDPIQGGAGTSLNMNVNEVVANRASEILGGAKGEYLCHPNDHVNKAQSTNDVIPTAAKMTVLGLAKAFLAALDGLIGAMEEKAAQFDGVIKMGRTQLQDAVPIRLGQEFSAHAAAVKRCKLRIENSLSEMRTVNLGGTAIGTKVNASDGYVVGILPQLNKECGENLIHAENLIDSTQNADGFVAVSGCLKACASVLCKICNDLRLQSSGPQTGLGEIKLPAKQNGSSIMPAKVNPVIPEVVNQAAFLTIGNDVTITLAAEAGQLQLNAFGPVLYHKLFESLTCLTGAVNTLTENCIKGILVNEEKCKTDVEGCVGLATALCPYLGYKKCAELAKEALKKGVSVKDLVLEQGLLDEATLTEALNPYRMT